MGLYSTFYSLLSSSLALLAVAERVLAAVFYSLLLLCDKSRWSADRPTDRLTDDLYVWNGVEWCALPYLIHPIESYEPHIAPSNPLFLPPRIFLLFSALPNPHATLSSLHSHCVCVCVSATTESSRPPCADGST